MDGKHKGFRPCARAQRRRNGGRKRLRRCGNVDDGACRPLDANVGHDFR
jgi:hypothetical protein